MSQSFCMGREGNGVGFLWCRLFPTPPDFWRRVCPDSVDRGSGCGLPAQSRWALNSRSGGTAMFSGWATAGVISSAPLTPLFPDSALKALAVCTRPAVCWLTSRCCAAADAARQGGKGCRPSGARQAAPQPGQGHRKMRALPLLNHWACLARPGSGPGRCRVEGIAGLQPHAQVGDGRAAPGCSPVCAHEPVAEP